MAESLILAEKCCKFDALVVPVSKPLTSFIKRIGKFYDANLVKKIKKAMEHRSFAQNNSDSPLILDDGMLKIVCLLLEENLQKVDALELGAKIYRLIKDVPQAECFIPEILSPFAEDVFLGMDLEAYRFDKYKTNLKPSDFPALEQVAFRFEKGAFQHENLLDTKALATAVRYARDLGNEPPNALTPMLFAQDVKRLEYLGIKVKLIPTDKLVENGFPLLYTVGKASQNLPVAVVAEWKGNPKSKKFDAVLVGKGITFDAGGVNLKSTANLKDMKLDMAGAAAVMATLKAQALMKAKINLAVVIGLAENKVSANAYLPQDVLTAADGKTIEIVNTDAEGRLVLADCLAYAAHHFDTACLIDVATLTGSTANIFKGNYAAVFSRCDDLTQKLLSASKISGEKLWPLPMDEAFDKLLKSDIADIKQCGSGMSDASLAACFLQSFVPKSLPWAHLDIADCEVVSKPKLTVPVGASGFGVRLLCEFFKGVKSHVA